jgi:hypothetical protein
MEVNLFCNFVKTLKSSNLRLKHLKPLAMKRLYIVILSTLVLTSLTSCGTYKNSTTTPDDVYYSPGAPVQVTATNGENPEYYSTPNENYVKMRVQNPDKWSYFDDYNYDYYGTGYSPYGYSSSFGISIGFGTGFYSPWYGGFGYYSPMSYYNSYYAWNSFYNPYYGGVVVINGKNNTTPSYTRMSNFNPSAYQGNYYNTRPGTHNNYNTTSTRSSQYYQNTNSNSNFNRSTNSRPSNYSASPMRSSPSNFSSGGSSGGGGGGMRGGGFSRPGR